MKHILVLFVLLCVFFGTAQEAGSLKGKILDGEMYNEPMLMANISLKNTQFATMTNFNGNFEIDNLAPGDYTMLVSFLGYKTKELPITITPDQEIFIQETLHAKSITPNLATLASNDQAEKE